MLLSLCGCRVAPPPRAEIADARALRDPTRTYQLRARMRAEGDRRWQMLARSLRQALTEHDLVGLRGISRLPHGDKTTGFAAWIREELRQKVLGYDGRWLLPYVRQTAETAQRRAATLAPSSVVDPQRVTAMQSLAVSELRGVIAAAEQQITRVVTHCLMASATPSATANAASAVIRVMRNRTRAMAEYAVAKTHATSTLSAFRGAGVTHVGVVPERLRRKRIVQTAHGRVLRDAGNWEEEKHPRGKGGKFAPSREDVMKAYGEYEKAVSKGNKEEMAKHTEQLVEMIGLKALYKLKLTGAYEEEKKQASHPFDVSSKLASAMGKYTTKVNSAKVAEASLGDKKLTGNEENALGAYTADGYQHVNAHLRSDGPIKKDETTGLKTDRIISDMDSALNRASLSKDVTAVRAIDAKLYDELEKNVGKSFTDKGYTSVTTTPHSITDLWEENARSGTPRFVFVQLPEGSRALPVDHLTEKEGENEIITARGSEFDVSRQKGGALVLTLRKK